MNPSGAVLLGTTSAANSYITDPRARVRAFAVRVRAYDYDCKIRSWIFHGKPQRCDDVPVYRIPSRSPLRSFSYVFSALEISSLTRASSPEVRRVRIRARTGCRVPAILLRSVVVVILYTRPSRNNRINIGDGLNPILWRPTELLKFVVELKFELIIIIINILKSRIICDHITYGYLQK
jgi:hypothetical protein